MKNSISCPRLEKRKDCPETHKNYNFEDLQRPETFLRVLWSEKSRQITKAYNARSVSDLLLICTWILKNQVRKIKFNQMD